MRHERRKTTLLVTAVAAGLFLPLAATGTAAAETATTQPLTSFSFVSEKDDWVGQGQSLSYEAPATSITYSGNGGGVRVFVNVGTGGWHAEIAPPRGETLHPGKYYDAERSSFREGRAPGLDVSGDHRGCNEVYGEFVVDQIAFGASGELTLLEATFLQRCESATAPALRGVLRYQALPLSYRFTSDPGDYVGAGKSKAYSGSTTIFGLTGTSAHVTFRVSGLRDDWSVDLAAPPGGVLAAGTYTGARRWPFNDEAPGLDVGGNGRGCNRLNGTFTIHEIRFNPDGSVAALSADVEQHCEGAAAALRGSIRYGAGSWGASAAA